MLGIWDVQDMGFRDAGCSRCVMFRWWNVQDVGCLACGIFSMRDIPDVGCWGCGMFRMWDVWDVGCGMWDADLQNADLVFVLLYLLSYLLLFFL